MRPLLLTLGFWLVPASVVAQQVQAFATDTIPAHLDSVVTRSRKDTTIQTLKQVGVIIWTTKYSNRQHLRDSLAVWCTRSCKWEWDGVVEMPDSGDAQLSVSPVWGVDAIHAPAVWAMGYTGQGVKVASLDSGIDPNHPGYVVGGGYNAITNESGNFQDDISQCNGHGTHVGGTLAGLNGRGVAPGSLLYGLKVFEVVNGQCLSYTSRQISALNYAINNNIRAVNISIGGANNSSAYQEAITRAWQAGIVIGAANGNSGTCPALMPGRADSLLGVASVNQQLVRSGFSNCGPTTDLSAPGEGIESTLPGGGYGQKSGTSMATPHVVGAAALVMSAEPSLSADSVMQLLRRSALPLGAQPNDYTGYGLVRPDRAIALARGGVWIAGPVQDTVTAFGEKCYPMVAVRPYTVAVTAGVGWRQVGDSVCLTLSQQTPRAIQVSVLAQPPLPILQIDPTTRYQTMEMWETSLRMWEQDKINDRFASSIETYNVAVANYLVDSVGINGVRVQVQSGLENPIDYWTPFVTGTMSYTVWSPSRYEKVNDNANPNVANLAGFQFAPFDYQMEKFVLPMKARLAARGESLHVNLNYLDFKWNAARQGTLHHATNPAEFAEFVLVFFARMRDRYGIVPDAFEVILEPENTLQWDGGAIGRGVVAVAARLAAAGFHPKFIVPSATAMDRAVPYFTAVMAVPGTAGLISMLAYHRYGGESAANLQTIRTTAASKGVTTGMLEKVGAGIDELMEDLTLGNVSGWQQWGMADESGHDDAGAYYARVVLGQPPASAISLASRTKLLAPVFRAVRKGAVRIGSSAGVAFQQPSGVVVILRATGAVSYEVRGLPVQSYQVTFTAENGTVTRWPFTGVLSLPGAGVAVVQ